MKILIVSQHFWPETFRISAVASGLARLGHDVRVLTGKPNYPEGRVYSRYRATGIETEMMGEVRVDRVPLLPRGRGDAARLAGNYASFVASASALGPSLVEGWRPDVVFSYATSPIFQAIPAIRIARRARAPLVTWVQDLWPESVVATGYIRDPRILAIIERAVQWIYARSDLILAPSPGYLEPIRRLANGTPVDILPNSAEPIGPCTCPPVLTLPPGFNVVFAGNLGRAQGLLSVPDAAAMLADQPDLRFVLVGGGQLEARLADTVRARRLPNVMLAGRYPDHAMPGIFAQADALLATLGRDPLLARVLPAKLQSYLAAGRPIIAAMAGEGAALVRDSGAGIACAPESPAALSAAVRELMALSPEARAAMGEAGQRAHAERFRPELLDAQLAAHFERLVRQRK